MGTIPACAGSTARKGRSSSRCRDHPRVRGEHRTIDVAWMTEPGPSPRARGALACLRLEVRVVGTIPACAGSTSSRSLMSSIIIGDHPRMRGEHNDTAGRLNRWLGPSPRARGAHRQGHARRRAGGTIPACAGSTRPGRPPPSCCRDHSRVRGEHTVTPFRVVRGCGPSPRARGARSLALARPRPIGTIPACAGSTEALVCGGHAAQGPSPRARGAQRALLDLVEAHGTIPAYAGSTPTGPMPGRPRRDHPRVRGEHHPWEPIDSAPPGPSSRARGARQRPRHHRHHVGTIPACAGSTRPRSRCPPRCRDHPRVRGEHLTVTQCSTPAMGPSPRARGARDRDRQCARAAGTIPACAGSTLRYFRC